MVTGALQLDGGAVQSTFVSLMWGGGRVDEIDYVHYERERTKDKKTEMIEERC